MKNLFVARSGTRSWTFAGCASLLAAFLFSSGALAADRFAAVLGAGLNLAVAG